MLDVPPFPILPISNLRSVLPIHAEKPSSKYGLVLADKNKFPPQLLAKDS
jgi:hypothetical protein